MKRCIQFLIVLTVLHQSLPATLQQQDNNDSREELATFGERDRNLLAQYLAALAAEMNKNEVTQIKTENEVTTQATSTTTVVTTPQPTTIATTQPPQMVQAQTQPTTSAPVTIAGVNTTTRRPTVDPVHVTNQVNKILDNVHRLNVTGIVDQSLQINTRPGVQRLVNSILKIVIPWPLQIG